MIRPVLLRPPFFDTGSSRLFSGSCFVTSAKSDTVRNRLPGLVGFSFFNGI